ncbi:unnamed protein product, partial [marine sediment metagenome]
MSAITPFLEHQDDPAESDVEREALSVPARISEAAGTVEDEVGAAAHEDLATLGRVSEEVVFDVGDIDAAALSNAHAGLLTTAWIRSSVEGALVGNSYTIETGGAGQREVKIVLAHPSAIAPTEGDDRFPVAAWSPPATLTAKR